MQSKAVIELVLYLTALYLIQQIDNIFFRIASMGIICSRVQEDCERVQNLKQVAPPEFTQKVNFWKRVVLGLLAVGLLVPYAIVVRLFCQHFAVSHATFLSPTKAINSL